MMKVAILFDMPVMRPHQKTAALQLGHRQGLRLMRTRWCRQGILLGQTYTRRV